MMTRSSIPAAILVVMAGCGTGSGEVHELSALASRFVDAAAGHDSVGLAAMTTNGAPVRWALHADRAEPDLIPGAAHRSKALRGEVRGDTAVVDFAIPSRNHAPVIGMRFLRDDGRWLIDRIQLTDRL